MLKVLLSLSLLLCCSTGFGQDASAGDTWPQWRGPARDGSFSGPTWPERLNAGNFKQLWRVELGPSYSGPIVTEELVFTTETREKATEHVTAFNKQTGEKIWETSWTGSMSVPFFAAANGSWIRSTPAYDGESLYVAGMRDVLVRLDAKTGEEKWRVDFVNDFEKPLPSFGCVCSPLVDETGVYMQAGAAFVKLDKRDGSIIWRTLEDGGSVFGSAFSSPIFATIAGAPQILVQTRSTLAGVDITSGDVLWRQEVPSFRGMNILTPLPVGEETVFTSTYRNKSFLYQVSRSNQDFTVGEQWTNNAQAYMSTPVIVDNHAYMQLQNQRYSCIDLATGERKWTSEPFGKYASLVTQGNRILSLDSKGRLLLIEANPDEFQLIDELKISDDETWAHLALAGNHVFIRELNALAAYRWAE